MRKFMFYPLLAARNIRRNRQFYLPFILTCVATAAMFYIMCFLTLNDGVRGMRGAASLTTILGLGCIVVGLFSVIFLFYTNSFLMKRRQKEIGLYNILGMGKGHIAGILFFESFFAALITLAAGLVLGNLLSKLMLLLLCRLIAFSVPFGFEVSLWAVTLTVLLFCGIFLLILLSNLVRIRLANPITLLRGGNVGEKEPKTKWLLALLGLISLGGGYYIAIVTESPLQAIFLFFVAVLLVILGTYLLFTATSIAVLKGLRNRPDYYYTTKRFIPISGMLYRMKQNAVGLANICILSTMVLVMVSGTVCLYLGTESSVNDAHPYDITVFVSNPTGTAREELRSAVREALAGGGLEMSAGTDLLYLTFYGRLENGVFTDANPYGTNAHNADVVLISASEYAGMTGSTEIPADGEAYIYADNARLGDTLSAYGESFTVVRRLEGYPKTSQRDALISHHLCAVVSDERFVRITRQFESPPVWYYAFDLAGTDAQKTAGYNAVVSAVGSTARSNGEAEAASGHYDYCNVTSRSDWAASIYSLNGGFLFLGLFLGIVFLTATVLIIYYKQLSEGYDDKARFAVMQKVGLSRPEIRKAIRSQVLVVFFLPLGMAVIHIAFAFKMITKLLLVLSLTNVSLFAVCSLSTAVVFALIYGLVYALTARVYYRTVR
ncbi:MAG: ABC transporter permease [Oscillospiraceae bacterium]|jgi:putative ABC transport system permease protein|nr:ABC transporter permease [Oscillospiraceae bacterium]